MVEVEVILDDDTNHAAIKLPGFCSICWGRDLYRGMTLQQCRFCRVMYHNECYGRAGHFPRDNNHICWACHSVQSKDVTIKGRTRNGITQTVPVSKERPTECCLCNVDLPVSVLPLAMHPVYDHHGVKGRPLILEAHSHKPARPAWCHTLCAFFINTYEGTNGCVFGCHDNGDYEGMADEEDDDDDLSVNSEVAGKKSSNEDVVHHFVYVLKKHRRSRSRSRADQDNPWTLAIREHQKLQCIHCGKSDKADNVFRIPVQCCANNEDELHPGCHPDLKGEDCYQAMHVGCTIWGRDESGEWPKQRQLFFFPSPQNDEYTKALANIFCPVHAEDLKKNKVGGWYWLRYPNVEGGVIHESNTPASSSTINNTAARRRLDSVETAKTATSHTHASRQRGQSVIAATRGLGIGRVGATDRVRGRLVHPQRAAADIRKRSSLSLSSAIAAVNTNGHATSNTKTHRAIPSLTFHEPGTSTTSQHHTGRVRRDSHTIGALKVNAAQAVAAAKPRTSSLVVKNHPSSKSGSKKERIVTEMAEDVWKYIRLLKSDNERKTRLLGRKKYWKRQSLLSSDEFKEVWPLAARKAYIKAGFIKATANDSTTGVVRDTAKTREISENDVSETRQEQSLIDEIVENIVAHCLVPAKDGSGDLEADQEKFAEHKKVWREKLALQKEEFKVLWRKVRQGLMEHFVFDPPTKDDAVDVGVGGEDITVAGGDEDVDATGDEAHLERDDDVVIDLSLVDTMEEADDDNVDTTDPNALLMDTTEDETLKVDQAVSTAGTHQDDTAHDYGQLLTQEDNDVSDNRDSSEERMEDATNSMLDENGDEVLFNEMLSGVFAETTKLLITDASIVTFLLTGMKSKWEEKYPREVVERIWPRVDRSVKEKLGLIQEANNVSSTQTERIASLSSVPEQQKLVDRFVEPAFVTFGNKIQEEALYEHLLNEIKRKHIMEPANVHAAIEELRDEWSVQLFISNIAPDPFFAKLAAAMNVSWNSPEESFAVQPKRTAKDAISDNVLVSDDIVIAGLQENQLDESSSKRLKIIDTETNTSKGHQTDSSTRNDNKDWSFLVVGKNYDPSKWSFDNWDSEEYITREEMYESMNF